ncbi:hypothetical protein TcasGA2_TC003936 [Tribolium castaneum]|uniref:Uncharacterized protein n=1 Tax=Tribolium castaneum TaxID=7070 RepID=D6WHQ2_TRICA|nr:hypothetical protein TcasGA2_TC003936 [Tribolium castaneum]
MCSRQMQGRIVPPIGGIDPRPPEQEHLHNLRVPPFRRPVQRTEPMVIPKTITNQLKPNKPTHTQLLHNTATPLTKLGNAIRLTSKTQLTPGSCRARCHRAKPAPGGHSRPCTTGKYPPFRQFAQKWGTCTSKWAFTWVVFKTRELVFIYNECVQSLIRKLFTALL